jgi:hypothetical protein
VDFWDVTLCQWILLSVRDYINFNFFKDRLQFDIHLNFMCGGVKNDMDLKVPLIINSIIKCVRKIENSITTQILRPELRSTHDGIFFLN